MSATEIWCLVAAILAAAGAVFHLIGSPTRVAGLAPALVAAALGCVAFALVLAFP